MNIEEKKINLSINSLDSSKCKNVESEINFYLFNTKHLIKKLKVTVRDLIFVKNLVKYPVMIEVFEDSEFLDELVEQLIDFNELLIKFDYKSFLKSTDDAFLKFNELFSCMILTYTLDNSTIFESLITSAIESNSDETSAKEANIKNKYNQFFLDMNINLEYMTPKKSNLNGEKLASSITGLDSSKDPEDTVKENEKKRISNELFTKQVNSLEKRTFFIYFINDIIIVFNNKKSDFIEKIVINKMRFNFFTASLEKALLIDNDNYLFHKTTKVTDPENGKRKGNKSKTALFPTNVLLSNTDVVSNHNKTKSAETNVNNNDITEQLNNRLKEPKKNSKLVKFKESTTQIDFPTVVKNKPPKVSIIRHEQLKTTIKKKGTLLFEMDNVSSANSSKGSNSPNLKPKGHKGKSLNKLLKVKPKELKSSIKATGDLQRIPLKRLTSQQMIGKMKSNDMEKIKELRRNTIGVDKQSINIDKENTNPENENDLDETISDFASETSLENDIQWNSFKRKTTMIRSKENKINMKKSRKLDMLNMNKTQNLTNRRHHIFSKNSVDNYNILELISEKTLNIDLFYFYLFVGVLSKKEASLKKYFAQIKAIEDDFFYHKEEKHSLIRAIVFLDERVSSLKYKIENKFKLFSEGLISNEILAFVNSNCAPYINTKELFDKVTVLINHASSKCEELTYFVNKIYGILETLKTVYRSSLARKELKNNIAFNKLMFTLTLKLTVYNLFTIVANIFGMNVKNPIRDMTTSLVPFALIVIIGLFVVGTQVKVMLKSRLYNLKSKEIKK